jgi:hypothetical protein
VQLLQLVGVVAYVVEQLHIFNGIRALVGKDLQDVGRVEGGAFSAQGG